MRCIFQYTKFLFLFVMSMFLWNMNADFARADGGLDTDFSLGATGGVNNILYTTITQPDGKIIMGGAFTTHNGMAKYRISRVNADGTMDASFYPDGYGANNAVYAGERQSDGKIVIGGAFSQYNGINRGRIARLNADGSLDTTFDPGTGITTANEYIYAIAIQSDGKILIGGGFTSYNGTAINRFARLNTDGSLDSTFNVGTGFNVANVRTIMIQSDGKILVGGGSTTYNGVSKPFLARINTDGSLDTTFSTGLNSAVWSIVLQPDGKMVVGGGFTLYSSTSINRIARLNADGSLDTSFDPGTGFDNSVQTISMQSDGKVVVVGGFTIYNGISANRIVRLNTDGSRDTTFNSGTGANDYVYFSSLQSDGKIVISGSFTEIDNVTRSYIARINTDGSLDTTFNTGTGARGDVFVSAVQSDGKTLIGGDFVAIGGVERKRIARLNTDGSLDTSFDPGSGAGSVVRAITLQSDGKILIGGDFTAYNGVARNRIARLNTDGSLDISFDPGMGANNAVYVFSLQSDGKIIVGGSFTECSGVAKSYIARLNTDGSLDATFTSYTNATVRSIILQSDGKIFIGGAFEKTNGVTRDGVARLNADGTLDTSFNPGTGITVDTSIISAIIQSDGKFVIGGSFTTYNGTNSRRIARLNVDGTLDSSFVSGAGLNAAAQAMSIQSDGKIFVGGDFVTYNNITRNRVARINTDGSLDTTFDPGLGADKVVYAASLQSDGKFIIGGDFNTVGESSRNRIARLNSDGSLDTGFNVSAGASDAVYVTASQSDDSFLIGGSFTTISGTNRNNIARLYSSGTLDPTFDPGTGANGIVRSVALQSNDRIIVGGDFTNYNGTTSNRITRVNSDGSLDTGYVTNTGTAADGIVRSVMLQSDEKAIIVGDFTTFNSTSRNRIARIDTGGSLDTTFNPGTGTDGTIRAVALQSDGKVLIVGDFTTYNGVARNRIARINIDGSLDTSFDPGTGANVVVNIIKIQPDNKILIGGDFTTVNGTSRNRIARLNTDGSLDTSFDPGTGMNGSVNTITIQNDNKIIAAGDFTTVNGTSINRISRLTTTGSIDPLFTPGTGTNNTIYTTNLHTPSTLFIGGSFITYNSVSSPYLARLLLVVMPTVTTNAATNITTTTLTLNADLTNDGGEANTRVIEWGTTTGTYTSSCTAGSGTEGTYSCNVTSLTPYTLYYFRAKSTNSIATVYGSELQVRTRANLATVTTSTATSIITSAATARANITSTGGNDPQRYIEYGTASGTYTQTCDAGIGTTGNFDCALTDLTPNTTYYYRAKTVNDGGTSYGGEVSFVTSATSTHTQTSVTGDIQVHGSVRIGN